MRNLSKTKNKNNTLLIIFMLIFICYAIWTLISQQFIINDFNARKNSIQNKISEQEKQQKLLEEEKQKQGTNAYLEKAARDKLNFVKENETVFIDSTGR